MNKISLFAQRPVTAKKTDIGFILCIILLFGLGFVTLYVSSYDYGNRIFDDNLHFVVRQLKFFLAGCVVAFFCAIINMDLVRKMLPAFFCVTLALCFATLLPYFGEERNGASRWFRIPFTDFTIQPSEFAKIAIVLFLANLLTKKKDRLDEVKATIMPAFVGVCVFSGIIVAQNDFSTAAFVLLIGLSMLFVAGIKFRWFLALGIVAIPILILVIFTKHHRVYRLIGFFNPDYDKNGINYQATMSANAISEGGLLGKGFTGVESVHRIPEIQADFVFAGWVEAMGFIGVLVYIAIIAVFAWKGFQIAFKCKEMFRSLTAFGCTLLIVLQSTMNCAVVSGAFPATGIPLPFFSAGGTSILLTLGLCGLLINISRYENIEKSLGDVYE